MSRVSKESYAEVVKRPSTQNQTAKLKTVEKGDNTYWQKQRKLFFTNMAEDVTMVEIWKTFKQFGQISDIIVPTKRDRFGKRFGFIIAKNNIEASALLSKSKEITFNGLSIKMDWARKLNSADKLRGKHTASRLPPRNTDIGQEQKTNQTNQERMARADMSQNGKKNVEVHSFIEQDTTNSAQDEDIMTIPVDQRWLDFLSLSFTVHTIEDLKLDMMEEILLNAGWSFTQVRKLRSSCFLLTFEDPNYIKAINWRDLDLWVAAYSCAKWVDVIVPRVAWLTLVGLPFIVASDEVLDALIRPVGSLVRKVVHIDEETPIPCINICVITTQGENIHLSRKVRIDNQLFFVSTEESLKN